MWNAALLFLLTIFALFVVGGVAAHALLVGRRPRARRALQIGVVAAGIYAMALVGAGVLSSETVLAPGKEKHICELDCHLAYSVLGSESARELGRDGARVQAKGVFRIVTLRVRFDERTITPRRGDSPLTPGPRAVRLVDGKGGEYERSELGRRALESTGEVVHGLDRQLRPGESYVTKLVFDVPEDARDLRLLIQDADLTKGLLLGSENGPLHRKTLLAIDGETTAPAR